MLKKRRKRREKKLKSKEKKSSEEKFRCEFDDGRAIFEFNERKMQKMNTNKPTNQQQEKWNEVEALRRYYALHCNHYMPKLIHTHTRTQMYNVTNIYIIIFATVKCDRKSAYSHTHATINTYLICAVLCLKPYLYTYRYYMINRQHIHISVKWSTYANCNNKRRTGRRIHTRTPIDARACKHFYVIHKWNIMNACVYIKHRHISKNAYFSFFLFFVFLIFSLTG